jgi:hypothetical protein
MAPNAKQPIIIFINSRSGGGQGAELMAKFAKIVPPAHIFDLSAGGPAAGLKQWKVREAFVTCWRDPAHYRSPACHSVCLYVEETGKLGLLAGCLLPAHWPKVRLLGAGRDGQAVSRS